MVPPLSRADTSLLGRWWWTVDRWTLLAVGTLIGLGYVMMLAASPAVAERINQSRDIFILKQVFFLGLAGAIVVVVSLLSPRGVRRVALAGCAIALVLTALTLVAGVEIKGARRWIALPGLSLQPSEFLKPCFAVVAAWLMALGKQSTRFPGMLLAFGIFAVIAVLLKSQPDIGMLAVISGVFFTQLFVGGLNLVLVGIGLAGMGGSAFAAFLFFPHVHMRVMNFLAPYLHGKDAAVPAAGHAAVPSADTVQNYQVMRSLEAFGNGGLWGRGPGEGRVKDVLPDAHADTVFAVAGEEFGMILCLVILGLFAFIVLRGLLRLLGEADLFVVLAASGLVASFGLQAFVNMASTLALIPTKGMTLPFVSYGGSSVLAVALGIGMLLALTRRRVNGELL
jgi:cell division protein FtsW